MWKKVRKVEEKPAPTVDDVFVARQPIFDAEQKLVAYELLYRSSSRNAYDSVDGTAATLNVLRDAFLVMGSQLVGKRKAFINFNLDLLQKRTPFALPPEATVIEILEDVAGEDEVVRICTELKDAGYTIALDDFTPSNGNAAPLVELADIIKVDFRLTSAAERADIIKAHKGKGIRFLAEKVETPEEFEQSRAMGYAYFQGYFFGKPHIVSAKTVPGTKTDYLRMLQELNQRDMDFPALERTIKRSTYLTYTLLNYINSAHFGLRRTVGTIMEALEFLGEHEVRRWASLAIMTFIGADKPSEVSMTCLIRAKLCEALAMATDLAGKSSELFMTGMFSMLDVLVGRPILELLEKLSVAEDIRVALTTGGNRHGDMLGLVVAYERGLWQDVDALAARLGVEAAKIPAQYGQCVQWAEQVFDMGTSRGPGGR
jgi:EAL and modified HD-GYP domain-containing signal transduction protein